MKHSNDGEFSEERGLHALVELIQSGEALRAIEMCRAAPELALAKGRRGRTALMVSARMGEMEMLAELAPISNCHSIDHQGRSALLDAAWGFEPEHGQAAARLILGGAKIGSAEEEFPRIGRAIAVAAERQMPGFVAEALVSFSKISGERQEALDEALLAAARGGCVESARFLVQAGAEAVAKDKSGRDAVMWAAARGSMDLLLAAINSGSALEKDNYGKTALMIAAQAGNVDIVKALMPWSNLRDLNNHKQTALMLAAAGGCPKCVEALLPGSDVLAADRDGATALMRAAESGVLAVLEALLPASSANAADRNQDTSLAKAIRGGKEACVEVLAPLVNIHQKNKDGRSPLALAMGSSQSILRAVIRAGLAQERELGKSGAQAMRKEWRTAFARQGGERAGQALFDAEVERFEMDASAGNGESAKARALRM